METIFKTIHVGCGTRGATHLRNLTQMGMWHPVALVDVVERYFDDAVRDYGFSRKHCYASLAEALTHVEADVAVISSPATTHAQFVEEALKANLHVWVEKPLTCDLPSARRCVEFAKKRGRKLMVGNQARFTPAQRTMRRLLAEQIIGEPGYATLIHHKVRPTPYNPSPHEQLWQMCVHNFDSLMAILQRKPVSLCAHSFVPPWSRYRESAAVSAVVGFEGGLILNFLSSSDSKVSFYEMRVECRDGALVQPYYADGDGLRILRPGGQEIVPFDRHSEGWSADVWQFHMFYDYLTKDIEPETSGRKNLSTIEVCDAAQRSAESETVIRF
ncbi:MAG: Gfo/Idh/MocA family oxidoreductase [Candidatus Latescibacteria bacterium]|nr:Gfo/Idh/MocA family oxidoreductase [Candidatus Latescibacterota bacterium]